MFSISTKLTSWRYLIVSEKSTWTLKNIEKFEFEKKNNLVF